MSAVVWESASAAYRRVLILSRITKSIFLSNGNALRKILWCSTVP